MAGAAVSVILVSLLGIAAITGVLPTSHATAAQTTPVTAQAPVVAPISAPAQQVVVAPAVRDEDAVHKIVVHHHPVQHAQAQYSQQYSQAPAYQQPAPAYQQPAPAYQQPAPAYQQPAPVAKNSPIGIGVGAVVGGLLGNQVGGGNGKTLATIAGAVGGGFLGNEIAKRNP
ncbi:glycine zipper 2TM domain-containing protein [Rhodoferax sediminis]|uniref:Glycine zipper 2TM domain-containing protein n=1 Tax=Rhodoferax sediminis TaxID=2509614 RepID=A0A515DGX0_9BURK|nr:glycine zipper 2TM domain-containing protein [Rhodoferax sediminis]